MIDGMMMSWHLEGREIGHKKLEDAKARRLELMDRACQVLFLNDNRGLFFACGSPVKPFRKPCSTTVDGFLNFLWGPFAGLLLLSA